MNRLSFVLVFQLTLFGSMIAQSISLEPEVISSSGDFFKNNSGSSLSWTLGEPITESIGNANLKLSQGFQQNVLIVASYEESKFIEEISIYPNPVTSAVIVEGENLNGNQLTLSDLSTKVLFDTSVGSNKAELDFSLFQNGIYFLRIMDKSSNIFHTYKIIKQ